MLLDLGLGFGGGVDLRIVKGSFYGVLLELPKYHIVFREGNIFSAILSTEETLIRSIIQL